MADLLDFVFPKRCISCKKGGSYLCENCFIKLSFDAKALCLICNKPSYNNLTHPNCAKKYSINGCFSALSYNKMAKKLVYSFKYKPYLLDLKMVLTDLFYESIIQNEDFQKELEKGEWVFIPIPLFSSKLRKRGYNQAEILANGLSNKFGIKVQNVLERTRDTKTQVGLSNVKRKENVERVFEVINYKSLTINQNVFLVDDVVTTGSTLKEAANILKRSGAKRVIGLTLVRD